MSSGLVASVHGVAAAAGAAAAAWSVCATVSWLRYGHAAHRANPPDTALDRLMPDYEWALTQRIPVKAPAEATFASAASLDLLSLPVIRTIFRVREMLFEASHDSDEKHAELLGWARGLGWGVLFQIPGRELVFGAAAQPWLANVSFRTLRSEEFASFREPGFAKILWTIRADPIGPGLSIARTDTRVATTDAHSRAQFRLCQAFLSPGMALIRRAALVGVRNRAERRHRLAL